MEWLETIELRSAGSNFESVKTNLLNLTEYASRDAERQAIKFYSSGVIDSDFCIHLIHNSTVIEKDGSKLGLGIAAALKEFGLVNHKIWVEIQD